MSKEITVTLSDASQEHVDLLKEQLDDGTPEITDSSAINYIVEGMVFIERVLDNVIGMDDAIEFAKGVAGGSIIIVKKK